MERLKEYLQGLADNTNIKVSNSKIEQKTRNAIRNEFTDLLTQVLTEQLGSENVVIARTKEGVGVAVDNEKVGFIPIVLKPVFKDTAEDILEMAEDYQDHLKAKAEKEEEKQKQKAERIQRQAELREAKKRVKELQHEVAEETEEDDLE